MLLRLLLLCLAAAGLQAAPLATVREIRALTPEQVEKMLPVRLTGVITYHEPGHFLTYLQDETGGIYLSAFNEQLQSGDYVEIEGVTRRGAGAAYVAHSDLREFEGRLLRVTHLGRRPLPAATVVSPEQLRDLQFDSQWVAVSGTVSSFSLVDGRGILQLDTQAGPINLVIPGCLRFDSLPLYLRGLPVIASGALFPSRAGTRDPSFQLCAPSEDQVQIDPETRSRLLALPEAHWSDFSPRDSPAPERRLIRGCVIAQVSDRGLFLQLDEPAGWKSIVWVDAPRAPRLVPGQWAKAVGFPEFVERRAVLQSAFVEPGPRGSSPPFEPVSPTQLRNPNLHGYPVSFQAECLQQTNSPVEDDLLLTTPDGVVAAAFPRASSDPPLPEWKPGSRVRVRGICLNVPSPALPHPAFPGAPHVLVTTSSDVVLVSPPPWLTPARLQAAAAWISIALALALAWAVTLRRRVRAQTEIISAQTQRETRDAERSRIARDWHDSIEQHLAGIALQLESASHHLPSRPAAAKTLIEAARGMAAHSREEARRAIWNLRSPVLDEEPFLAAVSRFLHQMEQTTGIQTRLITNDTSGRSLAAWEEDQLFRMIQEAVTNALKHGRPTRIDVTFNSTPVALTLAIEDNGAGFDPANTPTPGAHFGLRGMQERADKLNGVLEISSERGRGTRVLVRVCAEAASAES